MASQKSTVGGCQEAGDRDEEETGRDWRRDAKLKLDRRNQFGCSVVQRGQYAYHVYIDCFKITGRKNFECSYYKQMIGTWGARYVNWPDLIIVQHRHILKYCNMLCKYV